MTREWLLVGRMDEGSMTKPKAVFSCGDCGALVSAEGMPVHNKWHKWHEDAEVIMQIRGEM